MNKAAAQCWNTVGVWGIQLPRCARLAEVIHCRNCDSYINAGRAIFDAQIPADFEAQWTNQCEQHKSSRLKPKNSVFVFRLGREWFALPVQALSEILHVRKIHRIPHRSDGFVLGLSNVRGQLKICFSLQKLLGDDERIKDHHIGETKLQSRQIVVNLDHDIFVFPVSETADVLRFDDDELTVSSLLSGRLAPALFFGVIEVGERKINCIDPGVLYESIQKHLCV